MNVKFQGLGWEVKLRNKRKNYFLTLVKEIVLGNGLKVGDTLQYFLVQHKKRNAVLIFLDGKSIERTEKIKVKANTFLIKAK